MADPKMGSFTLATVAQALSAYKKMMENYFVFLQNIRKKEVLLSNDLLPF